MTKKEKVSKILRRLKKRYVARPEEFVHWSNPLELVIGTILSAQCTDKQVNKVTKNLFKKYRSAEDYARAKLSVLEKEIYSTGFYKSKAKYLKGTGELLVREFNGIVPNNFEDLKRLPGVSNKTAHLIMAKAFGVPTGVAVDTHVQRLAPRLGLTKHSDAKRIEKDLNKLIDPKDYLDINEYLILHGRAICVAKPKCSDCVLNDICPYGKKVLGKKSTLRTHQKNRRSVA